MEPFPFKPRVAGWELTLACNMRCLHCGSCAGPPRPDELSRDEGFALIDQLVELGLEVITLSGGEPLLSAHWADYARRLADAGVRTFLITNALLLEENVDRLLAAGLTRIGISLDGLEATHDRIRAHPGSFRAAMAGIARARAAGIRCGAVTHVSRVNLPELPAMHDAFTAAGLAFWQVQITFHQGRMKQHADWSLDPSELPAVADFVRSARAARGKVPVTAGDNLGYHESPSLRDRPWKGCFAGRHVIGIDADGAVKGCLSLPRSFVEGYLRREPLRAIWEDPQRFRYNRYFAPEDLAGGCAGCEHGETCRAGCVVTAHGATGNRFDNPYCIHRALAG